MGQGKGWKDRLFKVSVWVAAEVMLNTAGLDDLADVVEFLGEGAMLNSMMNGVQTLVMLVS